MIVLGLDPSTDITGVSLLDVPETGRAQVLDMCSFDATAAMKKEPKATGIVPRLRRIRWTAEQIKLFIAASGVPSIDLVAYELGGGPGSQSDQAGDMALGCYLTLDSLMGVPVRGVMRGAACAKVGAHSVYREPSGSTSQQKAQKRARLKAAVILGVNQVCGTSLGDDQDAEADAIAVALAGGAQALEDAKIVAAKASQTAMKLRTTPRKKGTI